jgi:hypothetical protein
MKKKFIFFTILLIFIGCSTKTTINNKKLYSTYLNKKYLQSINFHNKNLALKQIDNRWYYIRKDGKAMRVILDEEGKPDQFREGLARTRINGKIGFFNKNLDMVLPPFYDYAFPFHNGISEVCIGCKYMNIDGHNIVNGGEWKKIDRTGILIEE